MARSRIAFGLVVVLLSAGCVPVTEPVGDIDKAEPNKEMLGGWSQNDNQVWFVDRPDVKGNPKGLMRLRIFEKGKKPEDASAQDTLWLFTATVGKHTYANLMLQGKGPNSPDFIREGAFAEWAKSPDRGYWVGMLTFKDDTLTLDKGVPKSFERLTATENIVMAGQFYATKPGWLTAYLDKNGPEAIFGGEEMKFARVKKK